MKGMLVSVYSNPVYRGCANGGISEYTDEMLLVGEGVPEIFEAGDRPVVVLKSSNHFGGNDYHYVEPFEEKPNGMNGYMKGGSFIFSSDSRFRKLSVSGGPLPIHDRTEAPSKY